MIDKVQKIREEVEKLHGNPYYMMAVKDALAIIDSLQEEPVSKVWHDSNEEPNNMSHCLVFYGDKSLIGHYLHYEPVLYNKQDKVFVTVAYPHPTGYKVEQKSLDGGCVAEVYKDKRDRISISDITSWCYLNDLHNLTQKEKPVSEEWIKELTTKLDYMSKGDFKKVFDKYAIDFNEEPVIEDLGDYINELSKQFPEVSFAKLSRIAVRVAKWQREHLWKPADGDDLPEIDREVIVLINYNAQCNIHDEEYPTYRVGFGHRPNPNGWDGKSIDTNVITHYTPKLYDKGGWNAPNIVYWLDARLPYEENKIIKEL